MEEVPKRLRAIVYVDGFNLYYGCLKGTQYRWLDLARFADLLLPAQAVVAVKYFTAIVDNPAGSVRQQVYIGAVESDSRVSTYKGHFLSHTKRRPRKQTCSQCGETHADVVITEEKGTDVNLSTAPARRSEPRRVDACFLCQPRHPLSPSASAGWPLGGRPWRNSFSPTIAGRPGGFSATNARPLPAFMGWSIPRAC